MYYIYLISIYTCAILSFVFTLMGFNKAINSKNKKVKYGLGLVGGIVFCLCVLIELYGWCTDAFSYTNNNINDNEIVIVVEPIESDSLISSDDTISYMGV